MRKTNYTHKNQWTGANSKEESERAFWIKVLKLESGCWIWTGAINGTGYGHHHYLGKQITAHRVAWIIVNGPILKGLCVLHRCDNRLCVNPDHLFIGTQKDNIRDCIAKGRFSFPPNPRGEKHPQAKVNWDKVREIRLLAHLMRHKDIAKRFNISTGLVDTICENRAWVE